jgi:alpha-1,2-mannosyltransferase
MSSWLPFATFALSNTLAAFLSPIQDCDEVFNYWEPSHYLNHGYGFQTWEYSPDYAIRSWAYTTLHSIVIASLSPLANLTGTKAAEFYGLRVFLALICAACQTRLYSATKSLMGGRIATLFLVVSASSTGMFHAAPAYLPSSFAMNTAMLGASVFMDYKRSSGPAAWILWFAIGAIVGWPFAAALALPFAVGESISAAFHSSTVDLFFEVISGLARSALIMVCCLLIILFVG